MMDQSHRLLSDLGGKSLIIFIVLEEMLSLFIGQKGAISKLILAHGEENHIIQVLGQMSELTQELVLGFCQPSQLILLHQIHDIVSKYGIFQSI